VSSERNANGNAQAQREQDNLAVESRMNDIGMKFLVLSGKGGVGKSTVAANLAVALAMTGKRVGLLDVDIHGPSIPKLMGLEGSEVHTDGGSIVPAQLDSGLKVMSIAFLLADRDAAVIWRGPLKFKAIQQFLKDVAWGRLDYLIIDSPPGTGDEPLSVAQLVGHPAAAVIVTTPQDVAIADVRRCVSFCRTLELPVAGLIENMSGFLCPHCGHRTDVFKKDGGRALADETNVPFLGCLPIDPGIVAAGDAGIPFVGDSGYTQVSGAFHEIVRLLLVSEADKKT